MKVISWNLNGRTDKSVLESQCKYLDEGDFDIITLQEVVQKSERHFKKHFHGRSILSSFDLVEDKSILEGRRKFGQLIISKYPIEHLDDRCDEIPFPERVLSGFIEKRNLEVHTTHVPPGSSNGVIKVEHFEGLFKYLSTRVEADKILTGDFNSPKQELPDGRVVVWRQKIDSSGEITIKEQSKWNHQCSGERWVAAEQGIMVNHAELGLKDAFRSLNGYEDDSASWFVPQNGVGRRFDHIFCPEKFKVKEARYDQKPRLNGLSDHSPLICSFAT